MTYKETLQWMFAQLPMYQQKGADSYNAKLDNIQEFSSYLGEPHTQFKSIHVAGTNGKGSSSHMLASVLQEAGYKVGLCTSPHLKDFRERIKINGKGIPKKDVVTYIDDHREFLENHRLSFFEMTVGMAFAHFAKQQVDIAIIEVGLGGRLDSTNIIRPEVSLITNIGFDHMDLLGNTLQKIALEKAGIIKKEVPVIVSETQTETATIFQLVAAQHKSEITFADRSVKESYATDLLGAYQVKNVKGVVACVEKLVNFKVSEAQLKKGLRKVVTNTGLLGRWQQLGHRPLVICDTAHNKEGLQAVLAQLKEQRFRKLHLVLGFVQEKDWQSMLQLFPQGAKYYFVSPKVPRGLDAELLATEANKSGRLGKPYGSVKKGLEKAIEKAKKDDLIYVGGSTFVVAEAL